MDRNRNYDEAFRMLNLLDAQIQNAQNTLSDLHKNTVVVRENLVFLQRQEQPAPLDSLTRTPANMFGAGKTDVVTLQAAPHPAMEAPPELKVSAACDTQRLTTTEVLEILAGCTAPHEVAEVLYSMGYRGRSSSASENPVAVMLSDLTGVPHQVDRRYITSSGPFTWPQGPWRTPPAVSQFLYEFNYGIFISLRKWPDEE